jgi:myo-inositol-1(or 4)-monophosphatase
MNNLDFTTAAAEIATEAGSLLERYYGQRVAIEYKSEFDLVTAADRASEKLIVERLRSRFPAHSIVGEEGGGIEHDSAYVWFVDPLDGTTNFAHGFPMFNVTLALEQAGEMVAGVIFEPLRGEMFAAERGSGAYLNNRRIRVSHVRLLEASLMCTGFPSRKRHQNINVHFYHQMAMATHGVRRTGSAALDLAYVACGRLDGFWEFGLNPWDMAAGRLLVSEAGGKVSDMKGQPHLLTSPHLLVDNGTLHDEILQRFAEIFAGHYRLPLPQL